MKLSKRLELLAYLVEKHKKGNILADIGTDHAYLPCYLIEKNIIDKAYACDVAKVLLRRHLLLLGNIISKKMLKLC